MNLRKLLCGLLALCLLLTMAPAALMEEAKVEEQIVELGGDEAASAPVEAEDYKAIGVTDAESELYLPGDLYKGTGNAGYSGSTYLALGESMVIYPTTEDWHIYSVDPKNVRVADVGWDEDEEAFVVTGLRTGNSLLNVTMVYLPTGEYVKCAVTVYVYDTTEPGAIALFVDEVPVNDQTLKDRDLTEVSSILVDAVVFPEGSGSVVYWSSDKTKVAAPYSSATALDEDSSTANVINLKGKGTAKITAKCGKAKASFTIKVTDNNAPKSISVKTDVKDNEVAVGDLLPVYTVISPRPYADPFVTFTLENTKYARFWDEVSGVVLTSKTYTSILGEGTCVLYGYAEGTVKLTAKTYNGKKASIKIKVTDKSKPNKIGMYGYVSNEKFEVERYDDENTLNARKPVDTWFLIVPVLYDSYGYEIDVEDAVSQYANVQWKSSDKDVAEIMLYKNYVGYSQDQYESDLEDRFHNNVYDLMDGYVDYAAVVKVKGTGTTKLTAKTKDGKKSFSVTLKVVDSHAPESIIFPFGSTVTIGTDVVIDLAEYVEVIPFDFFGKLTIEPTHSTSKLTKLEGTLYRTNSKGKVTIKVKAGSKSKNFTLEIK